MNTCCNCSPRAQTFIGLGLMAFMLATRFHHFGDALHLPDASWAIFFIAGFYLSPGWLLALLLQAVAVDVAAIGWAGVSDYCLTPAYAALQLAHGALWLGGRWLRRQLHAQALAGWAALGRLGGAALAAGLAAFALSNGAFYWLGGRVAEPRWAQFVQTWVDYAPSFLAALALYLALATVAHQLWAVRTASTLPRN